MRIGRRRALVLVAALGAVAGWIAVVTTIGDRGSTAGVPRDSERSTGTTIATADAHVAPSALAVPEVEAARASVGEQNSVAGRSSGWFVLGRLFEREYVLDVHGHELVETRTLDVDMDAVEIDVGDLVVK
ncbi:MAG: hypothetical protein AAGI22_23295 [Planctomycetota bacterium]